VAFEEMKRIKIPESNVEEELKQALAEGAEKEKELQKVKLLNHELSV
jgi:hypothetical protein